MGVLKKKSFLAVLSVAFVMVIFLNISLQDKYFPYWDPYNIERFSEEVTQINYFSDNFNTSYSPNSLPLDGVYSPLFFYNISILKSITNFNFFYLMHMTTFIYILLVFIGLYSLFSCFLQNKSKKYLIFLTLIYFFTCFYVLNRFSMGIRENLVLFIGLMFLVYIKKINEGDKVSLFLPIILYSYILMGHLIVLLIISSTMFLYLFLEKRKKYLFIIFLFSLLITLPTLFLMLKASIFQLFLGEKIVNAQGFSVSYFFIDLSYFREIDYIMAAFGIILVIKNIKKEFKEKKLIFIYSITVILGIALSYIALFGSKQNRFAIYLYIILSLILLFILNNFTTSKKFSNLSKTFIIFFIIIFLINTSINYKAYRPLNERNIPDLNTSLEKVAKYNKWFCGRSAEAIILYLKKENRCDKNGLNEVLNSSSIDYPIILTNDDMVSLGNKVEYIARNKERYFNITSGNRIIFPSRSSTINSS